MEFSSFSSVIPEGKHVMLSYHTNSRDVVSKISRILQDAHIPVWFDENSYMSNLHDRYGFENCFFPLKPVIVLFIVLVWLMG
jgi:hypothetical protein